MVLVEQIYTSCLSQASYYIESGGEAAVIDPSTETNHFIEKAKKSNSEIKFIFQTRTVYFKQIAISLECLHYPH